MQGKDISRLGRTDDAQEPIHGRDIFVFLRQGGLPMAASERRRLSHHGEFYYISIAATEKSPSKGLVSPRLLSLTPPLLTSPVPAAELGPALFSFPESSNDIDGMTWLDHEQVPMGKVYAVLHLSRCVRGETLRESAQTSSTTETAAAKTSITAYIVSRSSVGTRSMGRYESSPSNVRDYPL